MPKLFYNKMEKSVHIFRFKFINKEVRHKMFNYICESGLHQDYIKVNIIS